MGCWWCSPIVCNLPFRWGFRGKGFKRIRKVSRHGMEDGDHRRGNGIVRSASWFSVAIPATARNEWRPNGKRSGGGMDRQCGEARNGHARRGGGWRSGLLLKPPPPGVPGETTKTDNLRGGRWYPRGGGGGGGLTTLKEAWWRYTEQTCRKRGSRDCGNRGAEPGRRGEGEGVGVRERRQSDGKDRKTKSCAQPKLFGKNLPRVKTGCVPNEHSARFQRDGTWGALTKCSE